MEFSIDSTSPQEESFQLKEKVAIEKGPASEGSEDGDSEENSFSPAPKDDLDIAIDKARVGERAPAVMKEEFVTEKAHELSVVERSPIVEGSPICIAETDPVPQADPEKESVKDTASPSIEKPFARIDTPSVTEKSFPVTEKAPVIEEPPIVTKPTAVERPFGLEPTFVEDKTHVVETKFLMETEPPVADKPPVVEKKASVENIAPLVEKASVMKETPVVDKVLVVLKTTIQKMAPLMRKFRKELRALQSYQEAPSAGESAATISVLFLFASYIILLTLIYRLIAPSILPFLLRRL